MRHIFFAALCTLGVISGLLALPAMGEPHAQLVTQSFGDRLALTAAESPPGPVAFRWLAEPDGAVPVRADSGPQSEEPAAMGSLGPVDVIVAEAVETTAAPTTTTTTSTSTTTTSTSTTTTTTSTTTTSTSTTTTTVAPTSTTTTAEPAEDSGRGGVVVSPGGIVLPVLGGGEGTWRVRTPCGNEATIGNGEWIGRADVVLDPGHGGDETGSVGANGATEKELNLRIASIVKWYLEEAGYDVVLTRSSDIRMPLLTRAEIATALSPRAFVSIHHNGGATRRQDTPGTEVFVDGGNPEARRLGGILFEELTARMAYFDADWVGTVRNGVSTRLNQDHADLYGLHRFTPGLPSVITEVGYLSNPSEAELYVDNDVQWAHGRAIADGIVRWMTTGDPGSGYLPDFVDSSSSGTGGFAGCEDPRL